jgi:hypothetical protein
MTMKTIDDLGVRGRRVLLRAPGLMRRRLVGG